MRLTEAERLPEKMQNESVLMVRDLLTRKKASLTLKRVFDILCSALLLILLSPVFLYLAVRIRLDSDGPVLFRQRRLTKDMRPFWILKFRTMVVDAEKMGPLLTTDEDPRVTTIGKRLRRLRLDELPQLINILSGSMSFVGVRPEIERYIEHYSSEMYATFLLPAGLTSTASILFRDEDRRLKGSDDPEKTYIEELLPEKMAYNLAYLKDYRFLFDLCILWQTLTGVPKRTERE